MNADRRSQRSECGSISVYPRSFAVCRDDPANGKNYFIHIPLICKRRLQIKVNDSEKIMDLCIVPFKP
ncbi:MAG: hypothetical protein DRI57_01190 [Deltaproteobacteria bacterium]|nr:MAG: hypothetical protein DRI57_01190 [Deltaproteobacteria bacterium]